MNLKSFTSKSSINQIFIVIALLLWLGNTCLSLHGEVREIIDARQMLNNEDNIANCLRKSLEKGQYGLIKSIISVYDQQYEQLIIKIFEKQLQRLKILQQQIILEETNFTPVIKWGQNQTHLFISMKMSHRWDSPPCLNTKHQKHIITNSSFSYINICVVSQSKINFYININFYQEIVDQEITIQNGGVGIYSTIIYKGKAKVWPFLNQQQTSFQKWLQIAERYQSIEKQYNSLLEGILRAKKSKPSSLESSKTPSQTSNNISSETTASNENQIISDQKTIKEDPTQITDNNAKQQIFQQKNNEKLQIPQQQADLNSQKQQLANTNN